MPDLKGKLVGVDFDSTIAHYSGYKGVGVFGRPIENVKWAMEQLKNLGVIIVINTCRKETTAVRAYLKINKIPFDYVNFSPENKKQNLSERKLYVDINVDDKNVEFKGIWVDTLPRILSFKGWEKHSE